MTALHRLVTTQLTKATRPSGEVDSVLLCESMSTCYQEMERDRKRVDRANKLMQEELVQLTGDLERLIEQLRVQNLHFQAAQDNMSQGLCLLDAEGRLSVANRRFMEIYGLAANAGKPGRPMAEVLGESAVLECPQGYLALASARQTGTLQQNLSDGRIILIVHTPLAPGGSVDTFEDITERKRADADLATAHKQLLDISRQAGMAEVAKGVLHNVGNVLNSVNVSVGLILTRIRGSKVGGLAQATQLMSEHAADLSDFLSRDEKGKRLPGYLSKLVEILAAERRGVLDELETLAKSVDHIKEIVATQQSYAGAARLVEPVHIEELLDDAVRMNTGSTTAQRIAIVKELVSVPPLLLDKHLMLQILVNLIANAKQAMHGAPERPRQITLRADVIPVADAHRLRIRVEDNGEGIAPENLPRLFVHGFTTRKNGHGFGLHSSALAAQTMGGTLMAHSDGPGRGAAFTLELPMNSVAELT